MAIPPRRDPLAAPEGWRPTPWASGVTLGLDDVLRRTRYPTAERALSERRDPRPR